MPAVTADTLTLPRLPGMSQEGTGWRRVRKVVSSYSPALGPGDRNLASQQDQGCPGQGRGYMCVHFFAA